MKIMLLFALFLTTALFGAGSEPGPEVISIRYPGGARRTIIPQEGMTTSFRGDVTGRPRVISVVQESGSGPEMPIAVGTVVQPGQGPATQIGRP